MREVIKMQCSNNKDALNAFSKMSQRMTQFNTIYAGKSIVRMVECTINHDMTCLTFTVDVTHVNEAIKPMEPLPTWREMHWATV